MSFEINFVFRKKRLTYFFLFPYKTNRVTSGHSYLKENLKDIADGGALYVQSVEDPTFPFDWIVLIKDE